MNVQMGRWTALFWCNFKAVFLAAEGRLQELQGRKKIQANKSHKGSIKQIWIEDGWKTLRKLRPHSSKHNKPLTLKHCNNCSALRKDTSRPWIWPMIPNLDLQPFQYLYFFKPLLNWTESCLIFWDQCDTSAAWNELHSCVWKEDSCLKVTNLGATLLALSAHGRIQILNLHQCWSTLQ